MNSTVAKRIYETLQETAHRLGDETPDGPLRLARSLGLGGYVGHWLRGSARDSPDAGLLLCSLAQQVLSEQAAELSSALTERKVPHFFWKGMALINRVYDAGCREMADIDIHVQPSSRAKVLKTLIDLGYNALPEHDQDGPETLRAGFVAERPSGCGLPEVVSVDVAWGIDPIDRLLPRPDRIVPPEVWRRLDFAGQLPVPCDAHHVSLIIHHMVHHDMLHFRGLVDLALLWPHLSVDDCREVESIGRQLGVLRATRLLSEILNQDLGLSIPSNARAPADLRGKRARQMLTPTTWCTWAVTASDSEFVEITVARMLRRFLLLDGYRPVPALLMDALLPPPDYLRWRWPEASSLTRARLQHLIRVVGKIT